MQSISGEEAVEPETISESSSPIALKFCHNLAFEYSRVFIYGMGRDGMGLSHSNVWPGTASKL
jgi:hypothetical protein